MLVMKFNNFFAKSLNINMCTDLSIAFRYLKLFTVNQLILVLWRVDLRQSVCEVCLFAIVKTPFDQQVLFCCCLRDLLKVISTEKIFCDQLDFVKWVHFEDKVVCNHSLSREVKPADWPFSIALKKLDWVFICLHKHSWLNSCVHIEPTNETFFAVDCLLAHLLLVKKSDDFLSALWC